MFYRLVPPRCTGVYVTRTPGGSRVFIHTLGIPSVSGVRDQGRILGRFPNCGRVPGVISPPIRAFTKPSGSPELTTVNGSRVGGVIRTGPRFCRNFVTKVPFGGIRTSIRRVGHIGSVNTGNVRVCARVGKRTVSARGC